jgi:PAS domain S-box-containing protein
MAESIQTQKRKSLSSKVVRITVIVALLVGIFASTVQVLIDFSKQDAILDDQIHHIMKVSLQAAIPAARRLDEKLAVGIINGLLTYGFISEVRLETDLGTVLAEKVVAQQPSPTQWVTRLLTNSHATYTIALDDPIDSVINYGRLILVVDRDLALSGFFQRSYFVILSGILRNLVLALLLSGIYLLIITHPLEQLVASLNKLNPDQPNNKLLEISGKGRYDELSLIAETTNRFLITTNHLLEEERSLNITLKESQKRFQTLVEEAPEGILVLDLDENRFVEVNQNAQRIFNTGRHEILKTNFDLFEKYRDSRDRSAEFSVQEQVKTTLAGGKPIFEICIRGEKSHDTYCEVRLVQLPSSEHRLIRASLINITQHKQMEQYLVQSKNSAEAANRAKSEFLTVMSHEMRTPLNAILGMSEIVRETNLDSDQYHCMKVLHRAGENLLALIEDILDLSVIESGRMNLDKNTINLTELTEEAIEVHAQKATKKGLELASQIAPEIPNRFQGDQKRIRQVLLNLLGNAVKFTHQGKVELQVSSPTPKTLLFSVLDTGIGIQQEHHKSIFEPFFQVDSSNTRQHGGIGLGLSLCQRLVATMDGEIHVESVPNQGSRFQFKIPLRTEMTHADPTCYGPETASDDIRGTEQITEGGGNILLAEDVEENADVIKAYLKNTNYQLDDVDDGSLAVDKIISGRHYDLILMDIQMPGMDGLEATRKIRSWEEQNNCTPIPILALSAHAMINDRERSLAAGCDDHINKPVKKRYLLEAIKNFKRS